MNASQTIRAVGCLLVALVACESAPPEPVEGRAVPGTKVASSAPSSSPGSAKYPRGLWRLAKPDQLRTSVVWVSQILITHAHSAIDGNGIYRHQTWSTGTRESDRSRESARDLAREIQSKLARDASQFAELARLHSDEAATAARGGSLGGERAAFFAPWVLDALQATPHGRVTGVVESERGFHVLLHRAPPPEETVAGRRLVLRHEGCKSHALIEPSSRSREQALQMATRLADDPRPFEVRIREASEHPDRARGGDLGVWSVHEPMRNGAELEALAQLEVGEVSPPLDTPDGIVLLQRTEQSQRPTIAVHAFKLAYDRDALDADPSSRAKVLAEARAALREWRTDPVSFEASHTLWPGAKPLQWREGAGRVPLELAARALEVGELAPRPADMGWGFLVVKRVAATDTPALQLALPAPTSVDIDDFLLHSSGASLRREVDRVRETLLRDMGLPKPLHANLDQGLATLGEAFALTKSGEERVRVKDRFLEELGKRLGKPLRTRFEQVLGDWVAQEVLRRGAR